MNNNWFEKEIFNCLSCGHTWILRSNNYITSVQRMYWLIKVLREHLETNKEKKEG